MAISNEAIQLRFSCLSFHKLSDLSAVQKNNILSIIFSKVVIVSFKEKKKPVKMSNDPIEFLDSVLQAEELRWRMEEYGHDKTKYSISRSGRYKSINKKRDALKPELYKGSDVDKKSWPSGSKDSSSKYQIQQASQQQQSRSREKEPKYTKYYETNL